MSTENAVPTLYNIPAGAPFSDSLAAGLFRQTKADPLLLTSYRILLPTRRACRTLREAFLRLNNGQPLLLPRMQPLGDVDEEELTLELFGALSGQENAELMLDLPPVISPLRRQILLARTVMKLEDFSRSPDQAMALAVALGQLMDRIHTEGLDMGVLADIVPDEFAAHWQITLDFLKILSEHWPVILKENAVMEGAERRNKLLEALAVHWQDNPPATPVIAAGSTGSIPATARLLKVIAEMPQGSVILPGLDQGMDEESWQKLDDTHPQATLRHLLVYTDVARNQVQTWPCLSMDEASSSINTVRRWLATEMMRPAETSKAWKDLSWPEGGLLSDHAGGLPPALAQVKSFECETMQEEAKLIAAFMRQTLEIPGKTAALVTPDRRLARRVAAICRRWDIALDDSAGQSLFDTQTGGFLRLCTAVALSGFSPSVLLSLLRHRLCSIGLSRTDMARTVNFLEIRALRGPKPASGMQGLRTRVQESLREGEDEFLEGFLLHLEAIFQPFMDLCAVSGRQAFGVFLDAHIHLAESLAAQPDCGGAECLWRGDDGEAAALFLSSLREDVDAFPPVSAEEYALIMEQLIKTVTVRSSFGLHPRLFILGQLEARLTQADTMILGGLNEGVWPPDPGHDPWLSRPMMKACGLPPPERFVGLSAHDFIQGFCAPRVFLTRAKRSDGAPTVPARWLQRLDTVLQAVGIDSKLLGKTSLPYLSLIRALDLNEKPVPCHRPAPCPAVTLRPRELPVTKIKDWLCDPYSIYARYILKLRPLRDLEQQPDNAARGSFLHDVLNDFLTACPADLPENADDILLDLGSDRKSRLPDDPGFWDYWWPRFERLTRWLVLHEKTWRQGARPFLTETKGTVTLPGPAGDFTLTARVDRIDRLASGHWAIIDYKSGGAFRKTHIISGEEPQLPLEALILNEGGFPGIESGKTSYLGYWKLTGGRDEGNIVAVEPDEGEQIEQAVNTAQEGLCALIRLFDDPSMPYFSLPDPDRTPRFSDYTHLARVQEWSVLEAGEEAA